MNQNGNQIESRLWDAADELRANIGAAINDAMRAIEAENPDLKDVLPKTYNRFENTLLKELLKTMNSVPMDIEGDAFGKIYEYFLGHFAMSEGQKGGEFFTPTALRRTRDLLLPRLISGEVDVSELDISVPEEGKA